ncbi:hypothetical protein FOIG_12434 [Fusarium odoratissimum NRRL 54006]|uniref:Uncharacterized protein n=1 Tax=Fusarium odoratissimum (strain NRRL 54006) TaxID=1089451 RepID=X0J1C9_FUSO5|nr:uncharacterized protein FOIG_12434 [Fusarium odoratissimum NRRL 54006]EXL94993.1 hypothetical protein FOIG_12434 [Fusarium odoratissimum NRRL 54006]
MNAKNPWHEAAPRQATGNKNRKKCQKTVTDTRAGQDSRLEAIPRFLWASMLKAVGSLWAD